MTEEELQAQLEEQGYARAQEEEAATRIASQRQFEDAFATVRPMPIQPPGQAPVVDRADVQLDVAAAQQAAAMEGASRPRPVPKKQAIKPIATATPDPVSVAQKAKPITNQAASASPKFATKERGESGGEYTIKKGDSLSVIAQQNGTTVAEIARLNGIKDINFIRAGDSIKLPGNDADDAPIDKQQSGVVNGRLRDTSGINVSRDFGGGVENVAPEMYAFPGSTAWKGRMRSRVCVMASTPRVQPTPPVSLRLQPSP